jgi:hypothetical protein
MKPDYVFIVGVSRTGTTLLLQIFNKCPEMAVCRESFFLGHQFRWEGIRYLIRRRVGDLSDDTNVYKLIDFLYAGRFRRCTQGYWHWLRRRTDRKAFLEKVLAARDRSDRTIFAIMMEIHGDWQQQKRANAHDNLILGEKTPSHIYHVPTLLEWFPNSRIIHTFRDPRGIFASELRRRRAQPTGFPYRQLHRTGPLFTLCILLQVTYAWLRAAKLHFRYERLYPDKYYLLRFEDLVTNPEKSTKMLCDFLAVDFQDAMLEQKVWSRGFREGQAGFDNQAADRWKEVNPPWINSWFLFWGRGQLQALGYAD